MVSSFHFSPSPPPCPRYDADALSSRVRLNRFQFFSCLLFSHDIWEDLRLTLIYAYEHINDFWWSKFQFYFLLSRGAKCSVVRFSIALSGVWCLIHFDVPWKDIKNINVSLLLFIGVQQWAPLISGFFFFLLISIV